MSRIRLLVAVAFGLSSAAIAQTDLSVFSGSPMKSTEIRQVCDARIAANKAGYFPTVFYEKYGVSARIAYNRREKFLQTLAGGPGNEPVFVRTYGQFDGSAAYSVTENAQIFIEGTNLFNAKYVTTGRFDNQVLNYQNTGPRYDIGFRLNF